MSPRTAKVALLALTLMATQSSCIAVGYSSRGGWFMWPGGLGLLVMIVLFLLFYFRR